MLYREPHPPVPPPSAAEYIGRAKVREDYAAELNAAGLYDSAGRQWAIAHALRKAAEECVS